MTILNTEVIKEPNDFIITCFLACMVICFVILFLSFIAQSECLCSVSVAGIIIFAFLAFISIFITNEYKKYNRYEVILDEEYSVKELYEKYDVIEQHGEIWVIEEKEKKINVK